jgi:hypothetical protein
MTKAKFSHVMNDTDTGITFLYFDGGSIQSLNDRDVDHDYLSEFCVHMDSHDHKKLETALKKEPYDCVTFNELEMKIIKAWFKYGHVGQFIQPSSMSNSEWKEFLEKLS